MFRDLCELRRCADGALDKWIRCRYSMDSQLSSPTFEDVPGTVNLWAYVRLHDSHWTYLIVGTESAEYRLQLSFRYRVRRLQNERSLTK